LRNNKTRELKSYHPDVTFATNLAAKLYYLSMHLPNTNSSRRQQSGIVNNPQNGDLNGW
jgi:hypothetical protein